MLCLLTFTFIFCYVSKFWFVIMHCDWSLVAITYWDNFSPSHSLLEFCILSLCQVFYDWRLWMTLIGPSTCMNFLSQFYFLTPIDYSPWFKREIWPNLKRGKISETSWEAMSTKLCAHTFHINLYLHKFFEKF